MVRSFTGQKRFRKNFGRIVEVAPMPNLIALQKSSYETFLQMTVPHNERQNSGLNEIFRSTFPIKDFSAKAQLEYFKYELESPKYDEEECQQRGLTYAAPLKVTLRLVVWEIDEDTGARSIRDIKEQDVYMGDMPLMTDRGTFIVNGIERVIVSQMHRSPGVFFDHDKGKSHSSGKYLFAARVVPYRGSWLDFEFDPKDLIHVRIDRRRKVPVTAFFMALDCDETEKLRAEYMEKGADRYGVRALSEPLPAEAAIAYADAEEDRVRAEGGRPRLSRELVDLLVHGARVDGSRARQLLGLQYRPLEQALAAFDGWATQMGEPISNLAEERT